MAVYPDAVAESLEQLKYSGGAVEDKTSGRAVNFACGGLVEIFLEITEGPGIVTAARFRSNGCGFMVAAAEAVCSELNGVELAELHGLETIGNSLEERFGPVPEARLGCLNAVIDAVRDAFREHRTHVVAEFAGDKVLVCT